MNQLVSVIIPCYNEAGNVTPLLNAVLSACAAFDHEIICVDDGSNDGTAAELAKISKSHPKIRVLTLKRNFGQSGKTHFFHDDYRR
jgi:dolichol-phosphate mannosyltransferase